MADRLRIEIELPSLTDEERAQLSAILEVDDEDLDGELASYVTASSEEYLRMFLGQRVFTRGSDIREYRLLLLIKTALGGRIPGEAEVSRLFQTTESQSRSLIRSVMSKFQYDLHEEIDATLRDLIVDVEHEEIDGDLTDVDLVIDSDNLVDELNRRIQAMDGTLPAVQKKRGTASTYVVKPSSFTRLRQRLNAGGDAG